LSREEGASAARALPDKETMRSGVIKRQANLDVFMEIVRKDVELE
jgi:hypothetical protein